MANVKTIEKINTREIRRKLGLTFWSTLGVLPERRLRYESGHDVPSPCANSSAWCTLSRWTSVDDAKLGSCGISEEPGDRNS